MKIKIFDYFFELLKGGLWGKDILLLPYGEIDYPSVLRLAEEQSIVGLITAGLDCVVDAKIPQADVLQFVGKTLHLEQQNTAMNQFICRLTEKMREADICALLVKGQGIAQCYEKPLWRMSGDVELLLSDEDYQKARDLLIPLASVVEPEGKFEKHLGMTIDGWVVELHGTLHSGLSKSIDNVLDEIQNAAFHERNVRSWMNGNTQINLLNETYDAVYVFTHILQHFYKGGIGLRQICDWCRVLWTYKDSLNKNVLESQIRQMGLMTEWKAFGAFSVEYLGMPVEAMPFFSPDKKWKRNADKICSFILEVGNFGHNRDMSYYSKYPYLVRKLISLGQRCGDLINHIRIFPWDSLRFFPYMMFNGIRSALRGE